MVASVLGKTVGAEEYSPWIRDAEIASRMLDGRRIDCNSQGHRSVVDGYCHHCYRPIDGPGTEEDRARGIEELMTMPSMLDSPGLD